MRQGILPSLKTIYCNSVLEILFILKMEKLLIDYILLHTFFLVKDVSAATCSCEVPGFLLSDSLADVSLVDFLDPRGRGLKSCLAHVNLKGSYPQAYSIAEVELFQKHQIKANVIQLLQKEILNDYKGTLSAVQEKLCCWYESHFLVSKSHWMSWADI